MAATCGRWVRTVRDRPSIVVWRPADWVMPQNVNSAQVIARYVAQVRQEDGTRPLAVENEQSEITAHWQSPLKDPRNPKGEYDDGTAMAERLAASSKPFLTKEIYAGFRDNVERLTGFFRIFYEKSHLGGSTGIIIQHLPLIERDSPFRIEWLSGSGLGNRDTILHNPQALLPNWCDASQPAWTPTSYSKLFADLYKEFTSRDAAPYSGETAGELLVSGLAPDELVILLPRDPALIGAVGIRAAADGTAWLVAPQPGDYHLYCTSRSRQIRVGAQQFPCRPGYDHGQRVALSMR